MQKNFADGRNLHSEANLRARGPSENLREHIVPIHPRSDARAEHGSAQPSHANAQPTLALSRGRGSKLERVKQMRQPSTQQLF